MPGLTPYLLIGERWVASSRLPGHPDLFRIEAITPSAEVHYLDWVTTGGSDAFFGVVESSGYKTLRVSFTPWNAPLNPFAVWDEHPAHRELLRWRLLSNPDPDYLMLLALPGSFSIARLASLQARYPDLLFEVV